MANSINTQATVTSTVDGVRTTVSSNNNTVTSASAFIAGSSPVTSSAWTDINLSTLNDVILLTVMNENTEFSQSVIQVASGSAGNSIIANLTPGAQYILPWSGSLKTISVRVTGSYVNSTFSPVVAATPVQLGKGLVIYLAQES